VIWIALGNRRGPAHELVCVELQVDVLAASVDVRAVALVLHGGRSHVGYLDVGQFAYVKA